VPASTSPTLDHLCDLAFVPEAPACFGVVDDGDRLRLCDGPRIDHVDDLAGFNAPAHWAGIAFVGDGRGISLDDGSEHRLRMTFVLTRDGRHASSITTEDGTDRAGGPGLPDDRPRGHVADLCHRALGLAAAPEPTTPDDTDHVRWLEDVLDLLDGKDIELDISLVSTLLALHPRWGAPSARTWEDVHRWLNDLGCGWGRFTADQLAWMDAPTWARYVVDGLPEIDRLLARLDHKLSASASTLVHSVVHGGPDSVRAERGGGG
jgi:hypothetical protein